MPVYFVNAFVKYSGSEYPHSVEIVDIGKFVVKSRCFATDNLLLIMQVCGDIPKADLNALEKYSLLQPIEDANCEMDKSDLQFAFIVDIACKKGLNFSCDKFKSFTKSICDI